jgi:hypothetical protein
LALVAVIAVVAEPVVTDDCMPSVGVNTAAATATATATAIATATTTPNAAVGVVAHRRARAHAYVAHVGDHRRLAITAVAQSLLLLLHTVLPTRRNITWCPVAQRFLRGSRRYV